MTPSIDKDIMEKAIVAFNTATDAIPDNECYSIIARALQAARNEERERCANRADVARFMSYPPHEHPERIATAIRKGE